MTDIAALKLCSNCRKYKSTLEMRLYGPPYRWVCLRCVAIKARMKGMTPSERDRYLKELKDKSA